MPVFKYVNKDFFKKWSRDMAYVLGFFAADGYITVNKRGGQFWCIQITDGLLLNEIKKAIKSEHKISFRKGIENNKNLYRMQIGSIEMCEDLRLLGFNEKKTKSLAIPNITKKYFCDFVRGYFDGDGHVWVGKIHKERKTQTLVINTGFTSCSKKFLIELNQKLRLFGVFGGIVRKGNGNSYRLTFSVNGTLNLYDFMYNGVSVAGNILYLQRKKKIFEKFIKMRS